MVLYSCSLIGEGDLHEFQQRKPHVASLRSYGSSRGKSDSTFPVDIFVVVLYLVQTYEMQC